MLEPVVPGWRRSHLVTAQTADLFRRTAQPARPDPPPDPADLARLVLDGILEVEHQDTFLSGPEAHHLFFGTVAPVPAGRLSQLSLAALRLAVATGVDEPRALADRLYRYNTRPASPAWRRRFGDAGAVARVVEGRGPARAQSEDLVTFGHSPAAWRVWTDPRAAQPGRGRPTFKLYLSPDPGQIGEACRALRDLMGTRHGPFTMKVGRDLHGLLRPDKLVAYFVSSGRLHDAARRLTSVLAGMPAQGVPFTAALTEDGLLSWAADPGSAVEPPGPRRRESWRTWVADHLAAGLATALHAGAAVPPVQFALDRIRLDGVDPVTWTPPSRFRDHADY